MARRRYIPRCRYFARGVCRNGDRCRFRHAPKRRPTADDAAAVEKSEDKSCGICLETFLEKPLKERKFGILPNCDHCFCASCISTWRKSKPSEDRLGTPCPMCRVPSKYFYPSKSWPGSKDAKNKLIEDYKKRAKTIDCRFFNYDAGHCLNGNECLYRHALRDGTPVNVELPNRPPDNILVFEFAVAGSITDYHQSAIFEYVQDVLERMGFYRRFSVVALNRISH